MVVGFHKHMTTYIHVQVCPTSEVYIHMIEDILLCIYIGCVVSILTLKEIVKPTRVQEDTVCVTGTKVASVYIEGNLTGTWL